MKPFELLPTGLPRLTVTDCSQPAQQALKGIEIQFHTSGEIWTIKESGTFVGDEPLFTVSGKCTTLDFRLDSLKAFAQAILDNL